MNRVDRDSSLRRHGGQQRCHTGRVDSFRIMNHQHATASFCTHQRLQQDFNLRMLIGGCHNQQPLISGVSKNLCTRHGGGHQSDHIGRKRASGRICLQHFRGTCSFSLLFQLLNQGTDRFVIGQRSKRDKAASRRIHGDSSGGHDRQQNCRQSYRIRILQCINLKLTSAALRLLGLDHFERLGDVSVVFFRCPRD